MDGISASVDIASLRFSMCVRTTKGLVSKALVAADDAFYFPATHSFGTTPLMLVSTNTTNSPLALILAYLVKCDMT